MPGNGGAYAVRRRKKPVLKIVKPPPAKTNPSQLHRLRLKLELDNLTNLLPLAEEVRGRLDQLSVVRLSVGYLKVKSYVRAAIQSGSAADERSVSLDGVSFSEGELLLQALNGFVMVVTADGMVFYTSPSIQDFMGFHQSDVVHESVYDLVHTDDRDTFRRQLRPPAHAGGSDSPAKEPNGPTGNRLPRCTPPGNPSFQERSFCCRLRCLLDNTSGFLALNFNGHLKHLQGNAGADGIPAQLALFAIATPLQPPSVMAIRTKTLIFQTKHRMDFAPLGIDTRGKLVLGYSELELVTPCSGYQFIHAADMMYCADNHLKMMKTGHSGFTFFRLLTKARHWLWVQANATVVLKGGRPDFILARQKALTTEEGEEHLLRRRQQLPFNLSTGEGVLYDTWMDAFSASDRPACGAPEAPEPTAEKPLDPTSLLGSLRRQDQSVYAHPQKPSPELPVFELEDLDLEHPQSPLEKVFLDSHALLSVPGQTQASLRKRVTGDPTSEAMIDSLEQILEDLGRGTFEGLEVEDAELRDWGNVLVRRNKEREEASRELDHILANDIFSYVEEALRSETGGLVQDRTGNREHEPPVTDVQSGLQEQTLAGDGVGGVGCSAGPKAPRCFNTHQGPAYQLGPPSSCSYRHGNRNTPTQTRHAQPDATQRPCLASLQNDAMNCPSGSEVTHRSVHYTQQRTQPGGRSPAPWQQLPRSLHRHTLHSSHAAGSWESTDPSLRLRSSSSCMYEQGGGHTPTRDALPPRRVADAGAGPFTLSHIGAMQPSGPLAAACADVSDVVLARLRGNGTGLRSDGPTENGFQQAAFFCWNDDAQIPRVPRRAVVDPFAFPAPPAGSVDLSQNTGL